MLVAVAIEVSIGMHLLIFISVRLSREREISPLWVIPVLSRLSVKYWSIVLLGKGALPEVQLIRHRYRYYLNRSATIAMRSSVSSRSWLTKWTAWLLRLLESMFVSSLRRSRLVNPGKFFASCWQPWSLIWDPTVWLTSYRDGILGRLAPASRASSDYSIPWRWFHTRVESWRSVLLKKLILYTTLALSAAKLMKYVALLPQWSRNVLRL